MDALHLGPLHGPGCDNTVIKEERLMAEDWKGSWNGTPGPVTEWEGQRCEEIERRVHGLIEGLDGGMDKDTLLHLFDLFECALLGHFASEEEAMTESAFPDSRTHTVQHALFVKELADLRIELVNNGPSPLFAARVGKRLGEWLTLHLGGADRDFNAFLVKKAG